LCNSGDSNPALEGGPGFILSLGTPHFWIPLLLEFETLLEVVAFPVLVGEETPLRGGGGITLTEAPPTGCDGLMGLKAGAPVCLKVLRGTSLRSLSALRFKVPFVVKLVMEGVVEDAPGLTISF